MVFKTECASELPGGLVKTQIARPHLGVSDSVGLGWGLRIWVRNRFQGDTVANIEAEGQV